MHLDHREFDPKRLFVSQTYMLDKVISGGQTGAAQAGWRAARAVGIATGGWMPLALEEFHRRLKDAYLIHDGGPSHISGATAEYFDGCRGSWRSRLTPARASWLDQAELLIHAFKDRYLKRTSWQGREEFIRHGADS
jgi:Circularly permutated YpsA SLOG family